VTRNEQMGSTTTMSAARKAPAAVELTNVSRLFSMPSGETVTAVDSVDLTIEAGEFFTLLGPSGSGKTTILRCVAGLERPDSGEIRINGALVAGDKVLVPPQGRAIGMVFQSYAIWPHLSVFDNVAFPLRQLPRRQRPSDEDVHRQVDEALDVVGLSAQSARSSTRLSGGQQQRVAIARAIVGRPEVLLLDEPLSNLDAVLRAGMRVELRRLTKELGMTALYVTHDQTEALTMSDRIAVVHGGRILQCASPVDIYRRPAGPFVAEFVGSANRLNGSVTTSARAGELVDVQTGVGVLSVVAREDYSVADEVQVVIRPENLHLTTETETETFNYLDCTIETITFAGSHTNLVVRCNDIELQAEIHQYDELSAGDSIRFRLGPRWCTAVRLAGPSGDLVSEPLEATLELSGTEEADHG